MTTTSSPYVADVTTTGAALPVEPEPEPAPASWKG
jgi:hypothetical protein